MKKIWQKIVGIIVCVVLCISSLGISELHAKEECVEKNTQESIIENETDEEIEKEIKSDQDVEIQEETSQSIKNDIEKNVAETNTTDEIEHEENDMANSWRFKNGKRIDLSEYTANYSARTITPWTNINGAFYNTKGEKIEGVVAKGIDVSYHNGNIDWDKVKNTDVDYAIIRCGYGMDQENQDDLQWKRNADECTKKGIPFGTYLYSYATNVERARSEAQHVLRLVKGYNLSYPIYYDLEESSVRNSLTKTQIAEVAKTFCDTIEAAGYKVGIYANTDWFTNYLTDSRFDRWEKWVAQYNYKCTYAGKYRMWQCSDSGAIDGISTKVDLNMEFGDVKNWEIEGISTSIPSPQALGRDIMLQAEMEGDLRNLQYKFVWQKDDWKEWGVLQEFTNSSRVKWSPQEVGVYTIYMDVKGLSGNAKTYAIKYEINAKTWNIIGITTNSQSPQKVNSNISVNMNVNGDSTNLSYKFLWRKIEQGNDWAKWGVLKEMGSVNSTIWKPTEPGDYVLIADVRDAYGYVETKELKFEITPIFWEFSGITTNKKTPQELGNDPIKVTADTAGDNENLKYKFVWSLNNWKEWGVIQEYGEKNIVSWKPQKAGKYDIYVDVSDGLQTVTKSVPYEIKSPNWKFETLQVESKENKVGNLFEIRANISGNNSLLKYKFVWQRDNWKEWGVIQEFSEKDNTTYVPKTEGTYTFIVDIKDENDKTLTKEVVCKVDKKILEIDTIVLNPSSSSELSNQPVEIKAVVKGDSSGLKYKYVWSLDNWKEWGVIREYGEKNIVSWKPQKAGKYDIYVDISDGLQTVTKSVPYEIKSPNWKFETLQVESKENKVGNLFEIRANISGNSSLLKYKFVWQRDNWKEWGVIQEFSEKDNTIYVPKTEGTYTFIVNIKDENDKTLTKEVVCKVGKKILEIDTIVLNPSNSSELSNQPVEIKAVVKGDSSGLKYKYVWSLDNWKEWGVIQEYGEKNIVSWKPQKAGKYDIYVDISDGLQTVTKSVPYEIKSPNWKFETLQVESKENKVGNLFEIRANISGNSSLLKYKFVWQRDNWKEWGVIQEFSEKDNTIYVPKIEGTYTFIVNIKDENDKTLTKEIVCKVDKKY